MFSLLLLQRRPLLTRLGSINNTTARPLTCPTRVCHMPLSEFRDPVPRQQRLNEPVGRSWSARELRIKSFDDLHKLWLVLYKEHNMLLTEQQLSRRRGILFPQPDRVAKVKKSLGAIRQVLGERKRDKLSQVVVRQQQMQGDADDKVKVDAEGS